MTRTEKNAVKIAIGIIRNVRALNMDSITVEQFTANQSGLWGKTESSPKTNALVCRALNEEAIGWGLPAVTRQAFRAASDCHPVSIAVAAVTDLEVAA